VLVESGDELIRFFELDAFQLEGIINDQVAEPSRVERDDIALLAMSGLREQYLMMRIKEGGQSGYDMASAEHSLRRYLYEKYVYRTSDSRERLSPLSDGLVPADALLQSRAV
jgi:hypothetical protein